jgi:hypothetical protein
MVQILLNFHVVNLLKSQQLFALKPNPFSDIMATEIHGLWTLQWERVELLKFSGCETRLCHLSESSELVIRAVLQSCLR